MNAYPGRDYYHKIRGNLQNFTFEGQIGDIQGRLHKLYDALEAGKLELDDLAPRIKDLKGRVNELEGQQLHMLEHMREAKIELLGRTQVKAYVDDLRTLLSKGTLTKGRTTHARSSTFCRVQLREFGFEHAVYLQKGQDITACC
jgi:hypothetical protein